MEARTKIIAAVAVIMMCAAGLVGAGYAYTATTVNEGNSATTEYVTLTQDGTGKYKFVNDQPIYYNTVDHETYITYTLDNFQQKTFNAVSYDVVKVGASFDIVAGKSTEVAAGNITCKITLDNLSQIDLATNCKLIFEFISADDTTTSSIVYDGSTTNIGSFTIVDKDASSYYNTTVNVYYGYTTADAKTTAPTAQPIDDATFNFVVEMPGHNTLVLGDYTITAGAALSGATIEVLNGQDVLTVTSDYTITWKDPATGAPIEASTLAGAAGTHYILVITGAGEFAGIVSEYDVVTVGA